MATTVTAVTVVTARRALRNYSFKDEKRKSLQSRFKRWVEQDFSKTEKGQQVMKQMPEWGGVVGIG